MFKSKKNKICVLLVVLILATGILIVQMYKRSITTFTREKWMFMNYQEYGHPARELKRADIYHDLLKRYRFIGKQSYFARYLLGNPDLRKRSGNETRWVYEIDREYAGDLDVIRTKDLVLKLYLDTVKKVTIIKEAYIENWHREDYR